MAMMVAEKHAEEFQRVGAWLYLDEVMHRVLNDYTAMLSVVRLATLKVSDSQTGEALDEITHRLNASATAFRALSPPSNRSSRDLDEDLEALCAALTTATLARKGIKLTFVADPVRLSAQQCWKICLVVSELITNAARHAFFGREDGTIIVELSMLGNEVRCTVADDGAAPASIAPGRGFAILNAIAIELGGKITRRHTSLGSTIVLRVPIAEADHKGTKMIETVA